MNHKQGFLRAAMVVIGFWMAYWGYVAYQAGQSAQRLEESGMIDRFVQSALREKSEALEMMLGGAFIGALAFAAIYWIAVGFKSGPNK